MQNLLAWLEHYGAGTLFLVVFIEGFGIPAPGETMIIAGALLAGEGHASIVEVVVTAWCAAVLGDNLGFAIGHFGGRALVLRMGHRIGIGPAQLARVERFFNRHGGWVVAGARFIDGPRQLNGVVAGSSGMNWWHFLGFNMAGAALWVGVWGGGVYLAGPRVERFLAQFRRAEHFLVAAALGAVVVAVGVHLFRRARESR